MRIFTRKAYQFDHPSGAELAVTVFAQSFSDVPEWVTESTMYQLADQDEDIMVINSPQDEKEAELNANVDAKTAGRLLKPQRHKRNRRQKLKLKQRRLPQQKPRQRLKQKLQRPSRLLNSNKNG